MKPLIWVGMPAKIEQKSTILPDNIICKLKSEEYIQQILILLPLHWKV